MQEMLLNEQKIKKVKKQFEKQKNEEFIQASIKAIAEEFQGIDIVINNAGVAQSTPFEKITLQEFDKIMAINLRAPFMLTHRGNAVIDEILLHRVNKQPFLVKKTTGRKKFIKNKEDK